MGDIIRNYTHYTPLITLAVLVLILIKRANSEVKNRSGKSLFIGIFIIGLAFFVIGIFVGSEIYCIGSKYAECTLGGLFVGGPFAFTLSTSIYLYLWVKSDSKPS